jgi:hypothetical protein
VEDKNNKNRPIITKKNSDIALNYVYKILQESQQIDQKKESIEKI